MNSRERFISACHIKKVDHHPVWLMRQAGRYLPEHQDLLEKYDLMTIYGRPDLIFEASLQPWRRFQMDAVIVFSDILWPMQAMGPKLMFGEDGTPRFAFAIKTLLDVERLSLPVVRTSFSPFLEGVENLRHELRDGTALLGLIGAPWTLALYLIEGGGGSFEDTLRTARFDSSFITKLMDKITSVVLPLAVEQVRAGCDVIQIFDTWGGLLAPEEYRNLGARYIKEIVEAVHKAGAPLILYIRKSSHLLKEMIETGADVISVGQDVVIKDVFKMAKGRRAVQGNLDPEILMRPPSAVERETRWLLSEVGGWRGFIANLSHGVLPQTSIESVRAFVETVKSWDTDEHR